MNQNFPYRWVHTPNVNPLLAAMIKKDFKKDFFIAGGLNHKNIPLAIKEFNPYAVDLSSSLESNGYKDELKIRKVMEALNLTKGRYGQYGGQYISETLMNELLYLEKQYNYSIYTTGPEKIHFKIPVWAYGTINDYLAMPYSHVSYKVLEDNHVVIIRNNERYDVTGKKL